MFLNFCFYSPSKRTERSTNKIEQDDISTIYIKLFVSVGTLEPQLLEEPFVFAGLVSLFELGPDCEPCLLLLHGVLENLLVQVSLVEPDVNGVASRHQVVVVDNLKSYKRNVNKI